MSKDNFIEAINWIKDNLHKCLANAGVSFVNIEKAEKDLNVKFANSYKEFLKEYGSWSFEGSEIYGLYNNYIVDCTIHQREVNKDQIFPHYLVVIHALGNGELSCLDTSQMNEEGECPIVAWYFGATLPNGRLEVLAEDFGAFLLEKIQWGVGIIRRRREY